MQSETVTFGGIDASSTGETELGVFLSHLSASTIDVAEVVVEQTTNADAAFNIKLDGEYIFSSKRSVTAGDTLESFVPDQNEFSTGGKLTFEVTTAGSADVFNGGIRIKHGT
jgi:hypothetical protein